jgi:hypothetical protein
LSREGEKAQAMHVWKLMIMALGSGALAGTIGGTTLHPTLKPAPEQSWRQGLGARELSSANSAVIAAPPQDLSPQGWTYGAAQAFPLEVARPAARRLGYRWDDQPPQPLADDGDYAAAADENPLRPEEASPSPVDVPAVEAAEAARDAALDATAQGLDPATSAQPAI